MFATINGVDLFYEVIGEGRPVLVLHGGLGLDHTYFRPWLDPLAENCQLIFIDISGNGRSRRPDGFADVSHASWVAEIDAVRAHLGFDTFTLMGQSYGSFLAMEYAIRHQDRLDGLILISAAPALDYPETVVGNAQKRGTPEQVTAVIEGLSQPAADDAAFEVIWRTISPLYFHRPDPALIDDMNSRISFSAGAFNHAFGVCVPTYNVEADLANVQTRTLLISGEDDWITPPEQAARIAAQLPHAERHTLPGSGHFPFIEAQTAFLTVVRDWLAALP